MIDYEKIDSALGQNWYDIDPALQRVVRRECPTADLGWAESKLTALGQITGGVVARNAEVLDRCPPQLVRYDRWGADISEVAHDPKFGESKGALVALGAGSHFEGEPERAGRPTPAAVAAAVPYLVGQADTGVALSLGITPIVAHIVGRYAPVEMREHLRAGLASYDFDTGLVGGLFLSERDGGSDLTNTVHAVARELGDGRVEIDGEKWFCSNADADVLVIMARPAAAAPVSLYLVPRRHPDGTLNISIRRLKNKLGTRSCPTGEILFDRSIGWPLRLQDAGVTGLRDAMEVTNKCRQGVAMMGLAAARRGFVESAIQAHHWKAKGRLLIDLPIIREQLVDLLVDLEAATALGFECNSDRYEFGHGVPRMLIPAAKSHLCRLGVRAAGEALELNGGNGYSEDLAPARLLRDALANPIWEGTEHILALDVLRAIERENAHRAVLDRIDHALATAQPGIPGWAARELHAVTTARDELAARIDRIIATDRDTAEAAAPRLSDLLVRTVTSALLFEHAATESDPLAPRSTLLAVRHARRHLLPDGLWNDRIASTLARDLIAYDEISDQTAARAAAITG